MSGCGRVLAEKYTREPGPEIYERIVVVMQVNGTGQNSLAHTTAPAQLQRLEDGKWKKNLREGTAEAGASSTARPSF